MFREQPQAFVAIPFGRKPTPVGEVDFDPVRARIVAALHAQGVEAVRVNPGDVYRDDSSLEGIKRSDFVIADVTGSNPYVMLEVGMAIGLGKPLLLIAMSRSSSDLPIDIRSRQIAIYSPGDLDSVGKFVEIIVADVLAGRGSETVASS